MTMLQFVIITMILFVLEIAYFKIADKLNIIDKPNERSSHTSIVLRGGGIIYILGIWVYAMFFGIAVWPFLMGLTLIAGISLVDDIHSLPDSIRLVVQFTSMSLLFYQWDILHIQDWWIVILGLVLCVGITNAYNFMDGINGINGGYSMTILLPLLWFNQQYKFADSNIILVTIIANFVFLIFNFRPKGKAKCFAGDVGSVGIAFIIIYLLGALILKTGDFTYIIFLAMYGVDSVLTICHRIMLHENIGKPHRKHAYQLMANELKIGHVKVSSVYMLSQLAIAIGLILLPKNIWIHWIYAISVIIILSAIYVLFMKKYYHLHEAYLATIKK